MCRLSKWHRGRSDCPILPYTKFINARRPMQLQTSATTVDFFPVGTGKRFVKRVIWHKGEETEMTSFTTRVKSDALYDIRQYIANGATVTDFNLEAYAGSDYSPLYC